MKDLLNSAKHPRSYLRIIVILLGIISPVLIFVTLFVLIQMGQGHSDFVRNLTDALFFNLLGLAIMVIVGPTAIKLADEDASPPTYGKPEDWTVRMRTLLAVSLTLVMLIFVLIWFSAPERLLVTASVGSYANQTSNETLNQTISQNTTYNQTPQLNPFVASFLDIYKIVVGFFSGAVAAETVAKTLKGNGQGDSGISTQDPPRKPPKKRIDGPPEP